MAALSRETRKADGRLGQVESEREEARGERADKIEGVGLECHGSNFCVPRRVFPNLFIFLRAEISREAGLRYADEAEMWEIVRV